jgi:hypothetical protein
MKTDLTCLFLMLITVQLATADSPASAQGASGPAAAAVSVSGVDVRAGVTEDGRDVTLSVSGKGSVRIEFPPAEIVSEVRIGRWMNTGIALAIETRNSETQEVSYFWSTAWVNGQESKVSKPVVDRFLKSKIDYDVVGVVNSQSNSIAITLLRHQRGEDSQNFNGRIYVNNCPVGPGVKGVLFPLAVDSAVGQY